MLNIYLTSTLIWSIILVGLVFLFGQKIKDNGWTKGVTPATPGHAVLTYFFMSAIPIIRVLIAVILLVMATYTKEQFEAYVKEVEDEDN